MNLTLAKALDRYAGGALCHLLALGRAVRDVVSPPQDVVEPRTILLVKFWGLGNIVLLLPVIRALRRRFPDARLVFVSLLRNRRLLDECPDLDDRIYVADEGWWRLSTTYVRAALAARRERADVCIDFEQFARASVVLATLARVRHIVGLATPGHLRAGLHHTAVPYDDRQHMGQTYLDLARSAGVADRRYVPLAPSITADGRAEADAVLGAESQTAEARVVVLHPGSGDNFQGRRWPVASFAALADRLISEHDVRVVITGTSSESELAARVIAAMERADRAVDATGRLHVPGLVALLGRATALVTNDTAPVHIGSALGVPVFAFFGPNTPRLYGPLSEGSHAFYRDLPCSPCLTNLNYKTSLCRMPVCIRDISVEEVVVRMRSVLGGAQRVTQRGTEPGPEPGRGGRAGDAGPVARTG